MANRNKPVKLTLEQKQQQDDERYMGGKPSRMEVANYVQAVMENHYIPQLYNQLQLGLMTIQAILIEKGICTGEEIEEITKEFLKRQQEEIPQGKDINYSEDTPVE